MTHPLVWKRATCSPKKRCEPKYTYTNLLMLLLNYWLNVQLHTTLYATGHFTTEQYLMVSDVPTGI